MPLQKCEHMYETPLCTSSKCVVLSIYSTLKSNCPAFIRLLATRVNDKAAIINDQTITVVDVHPVLRSSFYFTFVTVVFLCFN